jgi:branched-subunit amino acid ABC-type transport system permease component
MNPIFIFGTVINGIELGLIYALIAIGFSLIFGTARIVFTAHGEIYMAGAMLMYFLYSLQHVPYILSLIIISICAGVFGLIIDRVLFRRLYGRDLEMFMVSLGLVMIISSIFLIIFGGTAKGVESPIKGSSVIFGFEFAYDKIIVALISLLLILGVHFFFKLTKTGQSIRAFGQDSLAAELQGISINKTVRLTFFISLSLAAAAGGLIAPIYFAQVSMGGPALNYIFMVVILGGIGSFPGAIVGGLFIGLLQTVGRLYMGEMSFLMTFVLIIIFLLVKPKGLFGHD